MHVFGLTGGIASGKTTVGKRFRSRGVPVIDADQVARDVVAPGTEGLAAVVAAFGQRVLSPDGSLDRTALGAIVFADSATRKELERIMHPRIAQEGQRQMMVLAAQGHRVACYEAALLVEAGTAELFRPLVVVAASEPVQIARTMHRDGCSEEAARARIASQKPVAEKTAIANYVVWNDGSREELDAAVDRTLDAICDDLGVARFPAVELRDPLIVKRS
jgi:dephospho-CoA kinase